MATPTQPKMFETPGETFRRIYYRLYSNSEASRAETIMANLSLLLLAFFELNATPTGKKVLSKFIGGDCSTEGLLEQCRRQDPDLVEPNEKFTIGDDLIRDIFAELDTIETDQAAHVMGDAFQALMGPRLRGDKGQFFTPRSLIRAIVEIVQPFDGSRVVDPACGTAGFLAETLLYAQRVGLNKVQVVGRDKDRDLGRLARAVLRITSKRSPGEIAIGNSLDLSLWRESTFDFVLTNPPFGAKIGIDDAAILRQYDFGHRGSKDAVPRRGSDSLLSSQDPQILFIELCVRLLKPGGVMGVVLPEGIFGNKQSLFVWDWLAEHGSVEALLDCPRTTFQPGTDTKTNVLFFKRSVKQSPKMRVAVAQHCGHDRRGRSSLVSGAPVPNDFEKIGMDYPHKRSKVWTSVANPSNRYFVPRYLALKTRLNDLDFGIADDSQKLSLGDLVSSGLLTIAKGHEVGSEAYGTGEVPFVRTSDISNFEIRADTTNGVSDEIYQEFGRLQNLQTGDVLLVVDGRYRIGAAAILSERNSRIVVQSHIRILQSTDHVNLDPYALLFSLTLSAVREQMRDLVFVQSTLGTVAPKLSELVIPVISKTDRAFAQVENFRATLTERDRLLQILSGQASTEVDV